MKSLFLRTLAGVFALLLMAGIYLGVLHATGNFHEVIKGKFYRSAQLSPERLSRTIERYGIRTVINLRGANPGQAWYEGEVAATRASGAEHVDFGMYAGKQLTEQESLALVGLMRNARGPILVHCMGGADRSGLASVMYLQQIAGVDEETAEWQLSPLYGHINLPFLRAYAMDDTWEAFEKIIGLPS